MAVGFSLYSHAVRPRRQSIRPPSRPQNPHGDPHRNRLHPPTPGHAVGANAALTAPALAAYLASRDDMPGGDTRPPRDSDPSSLGVGVPPKAGWLRDAHPDHR
jgi:hypothetical protein